MRFCVAFAFLAACVLFALPLTLIAAEGQGGPALIRASYRRPTTIPFPESNAYTKAKSALGKMLFFDPLLSGSRTRSCATCHVPSLSWGDGLPRAVGEDPAGMTIRSPTLIDVAFTEPLGWDGKFKDIEAVTFGPIASPITINLPEAELIARLSAIPGYVAAFAGTFGDGAVTLPRIELALATYERTIVAGQAPFDRWIMGAKAAISAAAKRGFQIFNGKPHCSNCPTGPSFPHEPSQDIGTAVDNDLGHGRLFPTSEKLRYAFKTPTLRDVPRRGPYMHNGSVAT